MKEEAYKPAKTDKLEKFNDLFLQKEQESLLPAISEKMKSVTTIEEAEKYWDFFNKVRRESQDYNIREQNEAQNIKKKELDFKLYRIQKYLNLGVGIFLFVLSFIVFHYYDQTVGAFIFGSALAALGISTISLKSILNKND